MVIPALQGSPYFNGTSMRLLALDTSSNITRWVGIEDRNVVEPVEEEEGHKHDSRLAIGVKDWLKRNSWDKMDAIAIVNGPGGYTGLRVGVAFTSALAASRDIPIVPVSTYEFIAARAPGYNVLAMVQLRKGVVRARLMQGNDLPVALDEPEEIIVECEFPEFNTPVLPLGDGYNKYNEQIDKKLKNIETIEPGFVRSEIEGLAVVAWQLFMSGRKISSLDINVEYGAEFQPTPRKTKN